MVPPSSRAPVRTKSEGMMDKKIIQEVDVIFSLSWRAENMVRRTDKKVGKMALERKVVRL